MRDGIEIIVGPGVSVDVPREEEVDLDGMLLAYAEHATDNTDVILNALYSDGEVVERTEFPSTAILVAMEKGDMWEKYMRDWAREQGMPVSHTAITEYQEAVTDAAQDYDTLWVAPNCGATNLLKLLSMFKKYGIPLADIVGPGIGYDIAGDSVRVNIEPSVWTKLLSGICTRQETGSSGVVLYSVAGRDNWINVSLDAYADLLHLSRSNAANKVMLLKYGQ